MFTGILITLFGVSLITLFILWKEEILGKLRNVVDFDHLRIIQYYFLPQ